MDIKGKAIVVTHKVCLVPRDVAEKISEIKKKDANWKAQVKLLLAVDIHLNITFESGEPPEVLAIEEFARDYIVQAGNGNGGTRKKRNVLL